MTEKKVMLEQATAQFIEKLAAQGGPALYTLAPEQAREAFNQVQSAYHIPPLPAHREDLTIAVGPTESLSLRIIRPIGSVGMLPAVLYVHGGGWILGNEYTFARLMHELALGARVAIVFVNYDLSPEKRYPIAIEQIYAALEYIAQHGQELQIDVSRLVVAGDSVGGNMATVTALLAQERGGPRIAYQLLFYPVTDARMATNSYSQFAQGPWLTTAAMRWFWDAYAPDLALRNGPLLSPLQASTEQLAVLPPTLIITAENDVLRDEGEAYAHKLMQAGVSVKSVRFLGTIHDFVMLNALAHTPATRAAMALATATLREVLGT